MKIRLLIIGFFLLLITFQLGATNEEAMLVVTRYALIVGANSGGKDRVDLQYATSDAKAFLKVMQEMGGISTDNHILLLNPNLDQFIDSFKKIKSMVAKGKSASGRKELIVYYSGHSDEEGLLLGEQQFPYKDFRQAISEIDTDIRLAIVDSCSSGVIIRSKGGSRRPAFLVDASKEMKGYAFLTSSSENEVAQESDTIKASFFTHYLISALRGAADSTKDGVVTLNEAYDFAFKETLARTEKTQYGPQHPSYDIQLSGTGDLVLTDIRETSAGLILDSALQGRFYIRDNQGLLVVELNKAEGSVVELGLAPGSYKATIETGGNLFKTSFSLSKGSRTRILKKDLLAISGEETVIRGPLEPEIEPEYTTVPFNVTFFPELIEGAFAKSNTSHNMVINLTIGHCARVEGCELSLVGSFVTEDIYGYQGSAVLNMTNNDIFGAQHAGAFNYAGGDVKFFQGAGAVNLTGGDMTGAQAAGAFNYAGGNLTGAQLSGAVNITEGSKLTGVQGSGAVNIANDISGTQLAGAVNLGENINGFQAAGAVNVGGIINGFQVAGAVNVASDIKGGQIGVLNIADQVSGIQIGVINISEDIYGLPVGLLNFVKNGIFDFDIWSDGTDFTGAGIRFGSRYTYTVIDTGFRFETEPMVWRMGLGYGLQLPLRFFQISADGIFYVVHKGFEGWDNQYPNNFLPVARLLVGTDFLGFMSIFAGVQASFFIDSLYDDPEVTNDYEQNFIVKDTPVRAVPTFVFGLRFF